MRNLKLTAKDVAIDMLRPYIERGDTIAQTKAGQMGSHGDNGFAQVGGYIGGKRYSSDYVVASAKGTNAVKVFKLKDIYEEVLSNQLRLI